MQIINPISTIGDAIRGSIIVERPEQVRPVLLSVIERVRAQGGKLWVKNFWAEPQSLSLGYVGVHIKIRMPLSDGRAILMELQLHLKAIMDGMISCAKERAHELYKEISEEIIPLELISSSQLIYLTAMTRLLNPSQMMRNDQTAQLFQAITHNSEPKINWAISTALLLHDEKLCLGGWNEQYQAVVPKEWKAVEDAWKFTAKKINDDMLKLEHIPKDEGDWTNTATSIDELCADANEISPFFQRLCFQAAASQARCIPNFGPNDACMKKSVESLQTKIKKDCDKALKPVLTDLMRRINRHWNDITNDPSVPFRNFWNVKNLDFSRSQIENRDLELFKYFSALEALNLSHCDQLTDEGLTNLKSLSRLKYLNLSGNRFTKECLKDLHQIFLNLESLNRLDCPAITDADLAQAGLQKFLAYPIQSSQPAPDNTGRGAKANQIKFSCSFEWPKEIHPVLKIALGLAVGLIDKKISQYIQRAISSYLTGQPKTTHSLFTEFIFKNIIDSIFTPGSILHQLFLKTFTLLGPLVAERKYREDLDVYLHKNMTLDRPLDMANLLLCCPILLNSANLIIEDPNFFRTLGKYFIVDGVAFNLFRNILQQKIVTSTVSLHKHRSVRIFLNGILSGMDYTSYINGWKNNLSLMAAATFRGWIYAALREGTGDISASTFAHALTKTDKLIHPPFRFLQ